MHHMRFHSLRGHFHTPPDIKGSILASDLRDFHLIKNLTVRATSSHQGLLFPLMLGRTPKYDKLPLNNLGSTLLSVVIRPCSWSRSSMARFITAHSLSRFLSIPTPLSHTLMSPLLWLVTSKDITMERSPQVFFVSRACRELSISSARAYGKGDWPCGARQAREPGLL